MLYFTKRKYNCTGCGACRAVCPVDCISFVQDDEGFSYPVADDSRCINCSKCERVCPVINNKSYRMKDFKQYSVVGIHKDNNIWNESTSGGAFTSLCEAYCEEGDAIFGAKFNDLEVTHDFVRSTKDIGAFRKSKYVQSNMGDTYKELKKMLENNHKVIFSGTPCQVAGVKSYLDKEYDNLLCIDLVCHGVGSPGLFKRYIKYLNDKFDSEVKSYTFRNKRKKRGRLIEYTVKTELSNGRIINNDKDLFNSAFLQALILRPSCGECVFANSNRLGDLTIADFKKKHELLPEAKELDNFSTIIINTDKGQKVVEQSSKNMKLYNIDIKDIIRTNNPLRQSTKMNKNREKLFQDISRGESVEHVFKKYITSPKLHIKIWASLPDKTRSAIKRMIR